MVKGVPLSSRWPYRGPLDTHGDRALQQSNRNDQVGTSLLFLQDPLHVAKRPLLDDYALPHFEKWPWLHKKSRPYYRLKRGDFAFSNRFWSATHSDHVYNARRYQYRKPILRIEAAKDVARE